MTEVLILLTFPEPLRKQYEHALRAEFPALTIRVVDHADKVAPLIDSAEVLMTFGPMLLEQSAQILARGRSLRWIQALGTGVDNIADIATLPEGVLITNIQGIHGAPVSEAAMMAMLALSRDLPRVVRNQERAAWKRWPAKLLDGKTVGILGVGQIAEALAPKCKAFGMTVVGISSMPRQAPGFDRSVNRAELVQTVGELDYLMLLTPYSAETRHLVNAAVLAAMKPTSYLINLARGGVVDEAALLAALQEQRIAGAARWQRATTSRCWSKTMALADSTLRSRAPSCSARPRSTCGRALSKCAKRSSTRWACSSPAQSAKTFSRRTMNTCGRGACPPNPASMPTARATTWSSAP